MLTADLVHARRKGRTLALVELDAKKRPRALALAAELLAVAQSAVGQTREELEEAYAAVEVAPSERRLAQGLIKLIEDASELDVEATVDPEVVRREVFRRASAERRGLPPERRFDRALVLAEAARALESSVEHLERGLYADLRSAQVLLRAPELTAEGLLAAWSSGQAQAVLLRATRLKVAVRCAQAGAYRALFQRMKFLQLLARIEPVRGGQGYLLEIDGPLSLFEASTRYGLKLALLLPALAETEAFALEAELRWGKERETLSFSLSGGAGAQAGAAEPPLPDEVARLVTAFEELGTKWSVEPAQDLLHRPGVGVIVPDLRFLHPDGSAVYLEVLGFWSRAAVWRRVELAQAGLGERMLFAVSAKLRVSEEALDTESGSALYVYKSSMSAKAVLERLERLRGERAAHA